MTQVRVLGMTCDHCVGSVRAELLDIDGVTSVEVDLVPGAASVVHIATDRAIEPSLVAAAIDEAGYDIVDD
jgi:copper chaperone